MICIFTLIALSLFADMERKNISGFSAEVIQKMENYGWPGNVRELENLMQRTALLSKGPIANEFYHKLESMPEVVNSGSSGEMLKSMTENKRDHIIAALKSCDWKVFWPGGAAELLDMNVSTLNSRIKKLGVGKEKPNKEKL